MVNTNLSSPALSELTLTRRVRFAVNPGSTVGDPVRGPNGYAGVPAMVGLGAHYELVVTCRGRPAAGRSYLVDIKDIDRAVRIAAIPPIQAGAADGRNADPVAILRGILAPLASMLDGLADRVRWNLTPTFSLEMLVNSAATSSHASAHVSKVLLRQRFDFAAAHRLHDPTLTDDENRRIFGKCNNIHGHGHNYQVEPCISMPTGAPTRARLTLAELEALTDRILISRFDHKHLNEDTPEFDSRRGGVNPSVENIAKVFHGILAPAIAAAHPETSLDSITVWETDRTSATYPA